MTNNTSSYKEIFSSTITATRFPSAVLIVMLHTFIVDESIFGKVYISSADYPWLKTICHVLKADLGEAAVPLFFFVSGFLFFYKTTVFNFDIYRKKIKSRFHSLLIPYLIWNSLFFIFVHCLQLIYPSLADNHKPFSELGWKGFVDAYWNLSEGLIPLWFVRDLIIINLFTPIIYFLIKRSKGLICILLALLYFTNIFVYQPGVGMRCSFYYVLGATFSLLGMGAWEQIYRQKYWGYAVSVLLIVYDTFLWDKNNSINTYINRMVLISMVFTYLCLFYQLCKHGYHANKTLAESSFFVFVFHMFIIYIPVKLWVFILPVNGFTALLMQLMIPILIGYTCALIYYYLKKSFPSFTKTIVGGR